MRKQDDPFPGHLKPQRILAVVTCLFSASVTLAAFVLALPVILERLPGWIVGPLAGGVVLALASSLVVRSDIKRRRQAGEQDTKAAFYSRQALILAVFGAVLVSLTALFHLIFRLLG